MATWSLLATVSNVVPDRDRGNVTSDHSQYIYVLKEGVLNHDVWRVDLTDGTTTQMITGSSLPNTGEIHHICAFKGDLYFILEEHVTGPLTTIGVYKLTGVDSYTKVTTLVSGQTHFDVVTHASKLYETPGRDKLVAVSITEIGNPSGNNVTQYTTDGSSWSSGTLNLGATPFVRASGYVQQSDMARQNWHPNGIFDLFCIGGSSGGCTTNCIGKYNESTNTWEAFVTSQTSDLRGSIPNSSGKHWTGSDRQWTDDWVSYTSVSNVNAVSVATINTLTGFAMENTGSPETTILTFNNGTGEVDTLETIADDFDFSDTFIIRLDDGEMFIAGQTLSASSDTKIFQRSEPMVESTELRYIGLAADTATLYLAGNDAGTLKLFSYDLETLSLQNTASFGAATYTELDNRTRGIVPVVKPANDGIVFVRGRDGSNQQVLQSEDSGATFADVSDGGWGTAKYCVALLADPIRPDDMVACFDDDDIYRSRISLIIWSKTGDSPVTLRAAARHPEAEKDLLLAAQAADSLRFTNNYGATFEDISDTVGTVNVIEVSR